MSIAIGECDFAPKIASQPISADWVRRQSKRYTVSKQRFHEALRLSNSQVVKPHKYRYSEVRPIIYLLPLVGAGDEPAAASLQHQPEQTPP